MMRAMISLTLCVAAAITPAAVARGGSDDTVIIPYEVAPDGSVPFVDLSNVPDLGPVDTAAGLGRGLLGLTSTSSSSSYDNDGKKGSTTYSSAPKAYTSHTRQSSSVVCKASASSKSFAYSRSAHVNAVAYAVKRGCSGKIDKAWRRKVSRQFRRRSATAVAKAWASAETSCQSSGNAYGCAKAYAYAQAWAKASVSAHAFALAEALNKCKCRKHIQKAKAFSYGYADEFKKLTAEVEAVARAKTCVRGYAASSSNAYSKCIQKIYAVAFAKAVAYAVIDGGCGYYYNEVDADASVKAKAVIDTWEYVNC